LKQPKNETKKKTPRWKRLVRWLIVDLLVAAILILLLFYKPGRYHPLSSWLDPNGRVDPTVSKELLPQLNNGIQARRPFRMTIPEKPVNEIIAPYAFGEGGVSMTKLQVAFEPNLVVLMGTATIEGAPLVVTMELQPQFDEKGLLNLNLDKVKVGAMNVTPLIKMVGKEEFEKRVAQGNVDTDDPRTKIVASLLTGQPFDPVFQYDDKKVRVKSVVVMKGQLEVELAPAK
jgi:hypothetical protein